jgi:DNA modification methylase
MTEIRRSVIPTNEKSVINDYDGRHIRSLDDLWKPTWFRHICALPREDLKFEAVREIAQDPAKWKESDVKSWCATSKLRYDLNKKVAAVFLPDQNVETSDVLPDAISQVPEQYQELTEKIWKGTFDKQPEKAIERAQAILKSIQLTDLELMEDCGYQPDVYDIWTFNGLDKRYGQPHPGNIPAGILFNTLYYWTEQGDLVIDPMAGGGVTIDVCKAMRRRCVAYDIDPKRQDIRKQDAEEPWPDRDAALVFIDPPYFSMMQEHYHPDGVSGAENIEEFLARMRKIFCNAVEALKPGGHVAVLIQNQTGRDVEMGKEYIDTSFLFFGELLNLGLKPVRRVSVPLNTQTCTAQQVEKAKRERRMLGLVRDLLVFRKEKLADG